MRKLRYILLMLLLCPTLMWAQRRYNPADSWEHRLAELSGFTYRDVDGKTDVLLGLHISQYTGEHHMVGLSIDGGWSAMLSNMPNTNGTPGGFSGGFHILYEYQNSGFLLQTGLGLSYQRVTNALSDTSIYNRLPYPWTGANDTVLLRHRFVGRRDMAQQYYARVPIYVGHYIPGPMGIGYVLAGVQLQYAFGGNTHVSLTGSTAGKFDRYDGIWEEMDNHGFRKDVPIERDGDRLNLKVDLLAHAEIGYEYATAQSAYNYRKRGGLQDCRVRVAGYCDMGILNICPNTDLPMYEMPTQTIYDFPTYRMYHVFASSYAKDYWLRNLSVGLRVTVLFGFKAKERVILGKSWNR